MLCVCRTQLVPLCNAHQQHSKGTENCFLLFTFSLQALSSGCWRSAPASGSSSRGPAEGSRVHSMPLNPRCLQPTHQQQQQQRWRRRQRMCQNMRLLLLLMGMLLAALLLLLQGGRRKLW